MGLTITDKDHLKKALCKIDNKEYNCTIWIQYDYNFLIQDFKNGAVPEGNEWKKYGNHSWGIIKKPPYRNNIEILKIYNNEQIYEVW